MNEVGVVKLEIACKRYLNLRIYKLMSVSPDSLSVVILGSWNVGIFTPKWVTGGRLTDAEEIQIEVPLDRVTAPIRLHLDDQVLAVSPSKLTLTSNSDSQASFESLTSKMKKICSDLEHTPVSGVGFNFQYIYGEVPSEILEAITGPDISFVSDEGYSVRSSSLKRVLTRDEGLLNLTYTVDNESRLIIDFNYHYTCIEAARVVALLEDDTLSKTWKDSVDLVNSITSELE